MPDTCAFGIFKSNLLWSQEFPELPRDANIGFKDNPLLVAVVVSLIVLLVFAVLAFFIFKWVQRRRNKLKKEETKRLLLVRLNKNWSTVLKAKLVDGLSLMPDEWKSAIVPVHSETGKALKKQLIHMGNQIANTSTQRCGFQRGPRLLVLKAQLRELTNTKIAPFFASRSRMYVSYLVKGKKAAAATTEDLSAEAASVVKPPSNNLRLFRLNTQKIINGILPWPKNTTPLFQQVMYLLRELDNMFKASYKQRFGLRVMDDELAAYTEWIDSRLPQFMPLSDSFVLTQNTPYIFDLYRQAAEVHSYYNTVCERIARETKATWYPAPLKKLFRMLEKAEHVQGNGRQ